MSLDIKSSTVQKNNKDKRTTTTTFYKQVKNKHPYYILTIFKTFNW